ncbi:UNKNOWN [Stylonychia lemnae]|uniref:Uncharacterized protein n=1 Tax=Stylonychia lemnae TaxID=5949 RepID=A0A078BCI2_STYLE|nr:UNKNOWN [Stylonychia lemnae]|eukprot:CDW91318.1 UNKNOWN [Stylonychia lemnae]
MISLALLAALFSTSQAISFAPKAGTTGQDIALVLFQGASSPAQGYAPVAQQIQQVAAQSGIRAFVSIPSFVFDTPEPLQTDSAFNGALKELKGLGFTGDNVFLAGHSLGGVMAQSYAVKHTDVIKGLILEGSVLLRGTRKVQANGFTKFNLDLPTLTLCGELDGLMRITRCAEAYYHQIENIDPSQKNLFPVVPFQGFSHWRFSSGALPSNVLNNDLQAEISEEEAHYQVASAITGFIGKLIGNSRAARVAATSVFDIKPLVEAMKLENSYYIRDACYSQTLINQERPDCSKGSPWVQANAQRIMGGDLPSGVKLSGDDNFHRVWTVNPVHLPQFNNTCDGHSSCILNSVTVTELINTELDVMDTGMFPIAALEMRCKLMSRQATQKAAGVEKPDFHQTDEVGNRCADINNEAIQYAYSHLSTEAKKRYDQFGQKLVVGDDQGPYNAGPLWIWTNMIYEDNSDKTTLTLKSAMMRTPTDYLISAAAGFHYCKLLSPFRAMEWMQVDGLKAHYNAKTHTQELAFLQ